MGLAIGNEQMFFAQVKSGLLDRDHIWIEKEVRSWRQQQNIGIQVVGGLKLKEIGTHVFESVMICKGSFSYERIERDVGYESMNLPRSPLHVIACH